MGLRRKGNQIDPNCLVAQRIKRLPSIYHKLDRFPTMKLSQMQDIGGCRVVLSSAKRAEDLVRLYRESRIKHRLIKVDDYIGTPRSSGYRGVHLIYGYYSDRNNTYNSLKTEMQIRSTLQHAWATAVETVGTFTGQALKSSLGREDWLRFFALMGTAMAFREKRPPVPETPGNILELIDEIRHYANTLNVKANLQAFGAALNTRDIFSEKDAHFFLLELGSREDEAGVSITISGYPLSQIDKAAFDYLEVERRIASDPQSDAVLVSVDSLEALRRAYPNYFLDTEVFIRALDQVLGT